MIFWASKTVLVVGAAEWPDVLVFGTLAKRLDMEAEDSIDIPSTSWVCASNGFGSEGAVILNTALSFPWPTAPRNLKSGVRPEDDAVATSSVVAMYMAAAVSGGNTTPGKRNTTM